MAKATTSNSTNTPIPDDDVARLMALVVALCGDQIRDYRPRIEALVAILNANARLKAGEAPEVLQ